MTEQEIEAVHEQGHRVPVKVSTGFAVLVPCVNGDWEIDVLKDIKRAVECGGYYWGPEYGRKITPTLKEK